MTRIHYHGKTHIKSLQEKDTTSHPLAAAASSSNLEYPYQFTGRLWFSPSLVPISSSSSHHHHYSPPESSLLLPSPPIHILSLWGYTLGGTVVLEYDTSPVGPYREYVTMSALLSSPFHKIPNEEEEKKKNKKKKNPDTFSSLFLLGQWGSRLYVSDRRAETLCRDIWGVPAEYAHITPIEEGTRIQILQRPNPNAGLQEEQNILVHGWKNTRILKQDHDQNKRYGNLFVFWTPTIKALWSSIRIPLHGMGDFFTKFTREREVVETLVESPQSNNRDSSSMTQLPIHQLRLSASAIRLHWDGFGSTTTTKRHTNQDSSTGHNKSIPLGVGLIVDNVLIEISPPIGYL